MYSVWPFLLGCATSIQQSTFVDTGCCKHVVFVACMTLNKDQRKLIEHDCKAMYDMDLMRGLLVIWPHCWSESKRKRQVHLCYHGCTAPRMISQVVHSLYSILNSRPEFLHHGQKIDPIILLRVVCVVQPIAWMVFAWGASCEERTDDSSCTLLEPSRRSVLNCIATNPLRRSQENELHVPLSRTSSNSIGRCVTM